MNLIHLAINDRCANGAGSASYEYSFATEFGRIVCLRFIRHTSVSNF